MILENSIFVSVGRMQAAGTLLSQDSERIIDFLQTAAAHRAHDCVGRRPHLQPSGA